MDVNRHNGGGVEYRVGEYSSVGGNHQQVWVETFELRRKFRCSDLDRLERPQAESLRGGGYFRRLEFEPAFARLIGPRYDAGHFEIRAGRFDGTPENPGPQGGRPHKNDSQGSARCVTCRLRED